MEYTSISHTGMVRARNEDSVLGLTSEAFCGSEKLYWGLFIVSDGVGGAACGEVASQLTVAATSQKIMESLLALYSAPQSLDFEKVLYSSIQESNSAVIEKIKEDSKFEGMASTIAAALIVEDTIYIGNVGDSRVYIFGPKGIEFCSKDHSVVQQEVDKGILTREEARLNPRKNIITQAIGANPQVEINTYTVSLYAENTILICSDGLWDELPESEIEEIVLKYSDVKKISCELLQTANERGGHDNVSIIVIRDGNLPSRNQLMKGKTTAVEPDSEENQQNTTESKP
jgi:serine/threonine protein phosphatase PrpC